MNSKIILKITFVLLISFYCTVPAFALGSGGQIGGSSDGGTSNEVTAVNQNEDQRQANVERDMQETDQQTNEAEQRIETQNAEAVENPPVENFAEGLKNPDQAQANLQAVTTARLKQEEPSQQKWKDYQS